MADKLTLDITAQPQPGPSAPGPLVSAQRVVPERKTDPMKEPEFVGRIPVRSEILVLPADPPSSKTIGWTVTCYNGTEVYKDREIEIPLSRRDDIQPGTMLIVPTLVGRALMRVERDEVDGRLYAANEHMIADLQFDVDDRHSWISTFAINRNALKAVKGK